MGKEPRPEPDDKEQSQRFVEAAQALGVDETGDSFEKALHVVKSSKPKPVTDDKKERN